MERLRGSGAAVSLGRDLQQIAAAGFDGISTAWLDRAAAESAWSAAREAGLQIEAICFPKKWVDDFARTLDFAAAHPVRHIDIHAAIRPLTLAACVPLFKVGCG